jgi:hypothetical protein
LFYDVFVDWEFVDTSSVYLFVKAMEICLLIFRIVPSHSVSNASLFKQYLLWKQGFWTPQLFSQCLQLTDWMHTFHPVGNWFRPFEVCFGNIQPTRHHRCNANKRVLPITDPIGTSQNQKVRVEALMNLAAYTGFLPPNLNFILVMMSITLVVSYVYPLAFSRQMFLYITFRSDS